MVKTAEKPTALKPALLESAVKLLKEAKRPVVYVGGGVGMANAVPALRAFLATTKIPSVATLKGLGAILPETPYYMGMIGMHGTKAANYATQEADLLIVLGARFDDRVTGHLASFAAGAKVIHADIDAAELGKLRKPDVALQGDLNQVLAALTLELSIAPWQEDVQRLINDFAFIYEENQGDNNINPMWLLRTLSNKKSDNAIVVTDVGQHQMWSAQHIQHNAPENFINSAGFGTMGFGLPAAIGAKKARPQDDVILVTGDGSIMMNIQELGAVKSGKVPVKILLLDNQRLGMVRQWQSLFFKGRHSATILDDNPDFVTLAKAFDIQGERIEKAGEVNAALDRLLASEKAYFLHVCIHEDENVWPLVPAGAPNTEMLDSL